MSYNLVSFAASFLLEAASPAKKSTSAQFQISPTYCTWKFFFLLGGTKYIVLFILVSNNFHFFAQTLVYFRTEGV